MEKGLYSFYQMQAQDSVGIRTLDIIQMAMVDIGLLILTGRLHLDLHQNLIQAYIRM